MVCRSTCSSIGICGFEPHRTLDWMYSSGSVFAAARRNHQNVGRPLFASPILEDPQRPVAIPHNGASQNCPNEVPTFS
jgi:hypothetical protein